MNPPRKLSAYLQTLRLLYALVNAGILKQAFSADCQVVYKIKRGGAKRWKRLKRELGID